ncbi:MAG: radical SAM protein [Planctomycetaceae bacterium]
MLNSSVSPVPVPEADRADWSQCRFLTCSVLPVRMACNLECPFCFSKSSVSSLRSEAADWKAMDVERYYDFARERGATRLVITGGGEPMLRPDDVVKLIQRGRPFFDEVACFTNGSRLTRELSQRLIDAGLSYLCYSRHHYDDQRCQELMGRQTPRLSQFIAAAEGIRVRATCVMTRGWIDSSAAVDEYIDRLSAVGVSEFTFKHTYVAYDQSMFGASAANAWSREHQVEADPIGDRGEIVSRLPWGPQVRRIGSCQVCYYYEPNPAWELENQLCRSSNLLSDGTVYASLEDVQSRLFQLKP